MEGVVALLAPESISKLTRWFVDNPRYIRLGGIVPIALGIWLARRQYQEEQPQPPWYGRWLGG